MRRALLTLALVLALPHMAWAEDLRSPMDDACHGGNCIVTAYMDHEGRDWNCGTKRYGNHSGTDYATVHGLGRCVSSIFAVASAAGRVVAMQDGEEDHCSCRERGCGRGAGNYVILEHSDGSRTTYAHLARGTVQVNLHDEVACGDRLGQIGMSGNTTGPHLHFEVRPSATASSVDPYNGSCSAQESLWTEQGAHLDLPGNSCGTSGPLPSAVCGDDRCEGAEACESCPEDCGICRAQCGDSFCEGDETRTSCAADCGPAETSCGDGYCESGEHATCSADCGEPAVIEPMCEVDVDGVGRLNVEDNYLPHVVACENGNASMQSLMAQAIAARSFMYYKIEVEGGIGDGESDQVYSCSTTPGPQHYEAVEATRGQIITYSGDVICAFFVAGAIPSSDSCIATSSDSDPTSTQWAVTINDGSSGADVTQSTQGWVNPANTRNRGTMGQNSANCLADNGLGYEEILRFFYGNDIIIQNVNGTCSSGPTESVCGDTRCQEDESCSTCVADCGACASTCGDGWCNGGETCDTCGTDCGTCAPVCGDGRCEGSEGCDSCRDDCGDCAPVCGDARCEGNERCDNCSTDCGACGAECGDDRCDGGEWCGTCETDCGACGPSCGDGWCDGGETCSNCEDDCGPCGSVCGDWTCDSDEDCDSCSFDCGECAPTCGDWYCDGGETCSSCPTDCGSCGPECGDGLCDWTEGCSTCPDDCGSCGAVCGDGSCDWSEDCEVCAEDCGSCGSTCTGHGGDGENGDYCGDPDETWRCVYSDNWSDWISQVCRDGEWVTFHIGPSDCDACCGSYSSGCSS